MVKCANCGFLAQRHKDTRELLDAEEGLRKKGDVPRQSVGDGPFARTSRPPYVYDCIPLCARLQIEFPQENAIETIQEERECREFMQWHPGFTPKEHLEMLNRQFLMEREDHRDAEMRAREDRRDQELRRLQQALHRSELWIMGGAVTIALIVSGVIAAIIEGAVSRGWNPSWWPF